MGEISDMILDGILDEETGEYIGDINEETFGDAAPGFPVSCGEKKPGKVACEICGKKVKRTGLSMHKIDVH